MNNTQRTLDLSTDALLRLSEIERLITRNRIIVPPPSRKTLISMCEDGTFRTASRRNGAGPWLIFESSFLDWVQRLQHPE